jgi:hypothetical protein
VGPNTQRDNDDQWNYQKLVHATSCQLRLVSVYIFSEGLDVALEMSRLGPGRPGGKAQAFN